MPYVKHALTLDEAEPDPELIGGKAASLVRMRKLGLRVPDAVIVPVASWQAWKNNGKQITEAQEKQICDAVQALAMRVDKSFTTEKPEQQMAVSIRSGARVSMPGMMDTLLNVGLNASTVADFGGHWLECYVRMISQARTGDDASVMTFEERLFEMADIKSTAEIPKSLMSYYLEQLQKFTSSPTGAYEQIMQGVIQVFESWESERAVWYREHNDIPHEWGTSVTIQEMVYGNRNENSATGVVFSRNPTTGALELYGDFLVSGQGEDVVSGAVNSRPISDMGEVFPSQFEELREGIELLEQEWADMVDVEFTIDDGMLYFLQCRAGKRTMTARLRILIDRIYKGLPYEEAVAELEEMNLIEILNGEEEEESPDAKPNMMGIGASKGVVTGVLARDELVLETLQKESKPVILLRELTSPEDIKMMEAADAIITMNGGLVSHAAIVCREWGKPCIVGVAGGGHKLSDFPKDGSTITMNAKTGEIWIL